MGVAPAAAAPPAYALTQNSNGTVSINNIMTAITALNARLAQKGIDETVIPATASCTYTRPIFADHHDRESTSDVGTFGLGRKYLTPAMTATSLPDSWGTANSRW